MDAETKFGDFIAAQDAVYAQVQRELTAGQKQSHWMWFIFPQLAGLGFSAMAQRYALANLAEARDYLQHPTLGPRLLECTRLVLVHAGTDIHAILGSPDDLKFRSCLTLFAAAAPEEPLFAEALGAFYGGEGDPRTIELLAGI